jgi:SMODS and SLOG-associating 2TM effector domain 3/SMODS and SLOG-associating 2TM effector domain 1
MEGTTRSPNEPMTLRKEDLPATYQAATRNSVAAQGRFLRRSAVGLTMVVLAAGAGSFVGFIYVPYTTADVMAIGAAAAFCAALVARISLLTDRPHKTWYGGRAAAESAKTLAWRFAVGGAPFQIDQDPDEVGLAFTTRLEEILTDLDAGSLVPPSGIGRQITPRMRELRTKSLEERKEAYRVGRIADQLLWYSRKAKWNKARSQRWNVSLIFLEILGLVGAIVIATGLFAKEVFGDTGVVIGSLVGWTGAIVAGGAAWLQTKQHSNLAEAYSVAALELSAINDLMPLQRTEEDWARFVSESEDAISREHTLWRASRTMT